MFIVTSMQYTENPSWAPVRKDVQLSEFVFQESWAIASDFCGIHTHAGELHYARAPMIYYIIPQYFSCVNFSKTLEITWVAQSHGKRQIITAEYGRKDLSYLYVLYTAGFGWGIFSVLDTKWLSFVHLIYLTCSVKCNEVVFDSTVKFYSLTEIFRIRHFTLPLHCHYQMAKPR